jgi:drug/metabolite transporter (DMT)-like permease
LQVVVLFISFKAASNITHMRGINYLAGFGTVFIFIGIFCYKAAFQKRSSKESDPIPVRKQEKMLLLLAGSLSILFGGFLMYMAISRI